jgi:hypothetical protein
MPTYLALIAIAALYGVYHAIVLWHTNMLLFWVGVMVTVISIGGAAFQTLHPEDVTWKWMLAYTIPVGFLVFAQYATYEEVTSAAYAKFGLPVQRHLLPGSPTDYEHAARNHYLSMLFPTAAYAISWIVEEVRERLSRDKGR